MMRYVIAWIATTVAAVALVVGIAMNQPPVQRIDCTWSEISPDFSTAMREACRKARNS